MELTRGWPTTGDPYYICAYLKPYANLSAPCGDLERWTGSAPAGSGGLKWIGAASVTARSKWKQQMSHWSLLRPRLVLAGYPEVCNYLCTGAGSLVIRSPKTHLHKQPQVQSLQMKQLFPTH